MIKGKRIPINLILGILIAFLVSQFVIAEGFAILVLKYQNNKADFEIPVQGINYLRILAFIIFITIISVFNSKKFKKINMNKISIYLILALIAGIVIAIQSFFTIISLIVSIYPNIDKILADNYFLSINGVFIIIFIVISVFLGVFLLLVNRKVKYIKFLTKEVKIIKDKGFGKTILVKGEDELAELCESINKMSVELREKIDNEKIIEKNKNELITNVSHDLRTPLTSILGYVDLLKKNEFKDKDKFNEYIEIIDERSKNLNKLINELFEFTKLDSHDIKLNYGKIQLDSLIEQLVAEYNPIFKKESLEIVVDSINEDIFAEVDVEKIVRALENLLTNAKKYSMKNTSVLIKLFQDKKNVIITISNTVENIKNEDLDNIFERFYKIDKSRNNQDSTGLGLSIVKKIIQLHNGKISVDLNKNIIEFKVEIPKRI